MIGRDHFYLRVARGDTRSQVLSSFLKQYYAGTPFIPREIMLQADIEDGEVIEEWLTSRRKQKVHIVIPKKGTKEKMVELAWENARMVLEKDRERIRREEGRTIGAVHEVEEWLGLTGLNRMEAFDISAVLSQLVPWWFMRKASRSGVITVNSGSSLFRVRTIMPVWKKC